MARMVKTLLLTAVIAALPAGSASALDVTSNAGGDVTEGGASTFQISEVWGLAPDPEPTVNVSTSDGTAVAGDDYGSVAQTTVVGVACGAQCTNTRFFSVPTVDDNIDEPDETFQAGYGWSAGAPGPSAGGGGSAIITIHDNDPAPTIEADGGKVVE